MKIFINVDLNKDIAIKTKEKLVKTCEKLNIDISNNVCDCDIIVSIGGDGTFLKSSKLSNSKAIVGINCGRLGYLTDINPKNIEKSFNEILNKNYYIEKRMMINGTVRKNNDENIEIPNALNEIAIFKNDFGIIRFDVLIDDKLINSYTADGILICTPTGSTAYNLSCGGPIVDPTANIITLTPIAPHSIMNRSIILSDKSKVKIIIKEGKSHVLFDGNPIELDVGNVIEIKKSDNITNILKVNWRSFIDTVRDNIN